jgi:hypothetical protein
MKDRRDSLEEFVRQNREAFDDREPSGKVWDQIGRAIRPRQSVWNSVSLWRAAAVIFMVLSGYLLIPKTNVKPVSNDQALKEFHDVENFYTEEISKKVELIGSFQKNEGLNGFTHDFKQLEAMYMVLKEEMKTRPSEKVKDALVLNLLVRIDLLNQQLHKLEESYKKDRKKETNV